MTRSIDPPVSLKQSADSGIIPAKYLYGLQCTDPVERLEWLRQAALDGYAPAMHEYELECDDPFEGRRWLSKATATSPRSKPR